jgi:hypothetical protein
MAKVRIGMIVAAASVAAALSLAPSPVGAAPSPGDGYTFAVIGDIPYGDAQIANFPNVIAQINADPSVQWVTHLGDIKSGSSQCTDEYFAWIKQQFDSFADPLVYTPGDNEWTDCPPAEQRRVQPARAAGRNSRAVLRESGTHARTDRRAPVRPDGPRHPRERPMGTRRDLVHRGEHPWQQQQPGAMDRADRTDA